ncbi:MAG: DUF4126 domain-containing protein [Actinomycetia bacterium]|nr:DUF4126 domain-containing protein [Actinomycetes bacterium]NHZ73547.1 DUF4126 family protein [Nitrospirota bacterium]
MVSIGILAGSGWASGINLYLVTLLLGFASRLGSDSVPEVFGRTDLMIVAGVLFAVEFVADKIPYVDNAWDAINTVVRPLGAAAIGAVIAGDATSVATVVAAVVAGALALNAHAAKASTRLAVNATPEPVSNISLSIFEDLSVAGLMALALTYPVVTVIVVVVLVVAAAALTLWLFRITRRASRAVRKRLGAIRSRT